MGEAVVSRGDPAEILEAAEHPLDRVAITVEVGREATLPHSGGLGRDVGGCPLALDFLAHRVGVIPLVAVQDLGRGDPVEQDLGSEAIGHLAAGQQERDRATEAIGQGMDFRGPSAARAADRLAEFPPFPPEAQR
jgi:hypothetical protein